MFKEMNTPGRSFRAALAMILLQATAAFAQQKVPVIKATNDKAFIRDGDYVKMAWHLDPAAKPDVYYVNIPAKKAQSN